jgi:hypothetical protein
MDKSVQSQKYNSRTKDFYSLPPSNIVRHTKSKTDEDMDENNIKYGIDINQLKEWKKIQDIQSVSSEEVQQEITVKKMKNYALTLGIHINV